MSDHDIDLANLSDNDEINDNKNDEKVNDKGNDKGEDEPPVKEVKPWRLTPEQLAAKQERRARRTAIFSHFYDTREQKVSASGNICPNRLLLCVHCQKAYDEGASEFDKPKKIFKQTRCCITHLKNCRHYDRFLRDGGRPYEDGPLDDVARPGADKIEGKASARKPVVKGQYLSPRKDWAVEELYSSPSKGRKSSLYGTGDNEKEMRRWLNDNRLPQSVGDLMVDLGAREIGDIPLIMSEFESDLQVLKPLDAIKLKKAVNSFRRT